MSTMAAVVVVIVAFAFIGGVCGGLLLTFLYVRRPERTERTRELLALRAVLMRNQSSQYQISKTRISACSLLDPTGVSTYALFRRSLAAEAPERSPTESFRASARTLADAYSEAASADDSRSR
jgi:hypothetical protein